MNEPDRPQRTRRDFLSGKALRAQVEAAGEALAAELEAAPREAPAAGGTIRLSARAMACEFTVILNPGPERADEVMIASGGLDLLPGLESQMTVYREESDLVALNRRGATEPVEVEAGLFGLLQECRRIYERTEGAFDATAGALIRLWREARDRNTIPTDDEIEAARERVGTEHVVFDDAARTVAFDTQGVEFNLGAIGKGYALDRIGEHLRASGLEDFLVHGGHSSILPAGGHAGHVGWPVGIGNPLFTNRRLATILLKDRALSTSGSNIQYFRHGGRRFGHILDPRTGRPAEGLLSVTVVAPSAAEADALSTGFFVGGVENALRYCDNDPEVGVVLIPAPERGQTLEPIVRGIADECLFFTAAEATPREN
jgi:thiamine biosynthesis lipoprotein